MTQEEIWLKEALQEVEALTPEALVVAPKPVPSRPKRPTREWGERVSTVLDILPLLIIVGFSLFGIGWVTYTQASYDGSLRVTHKAAVIQDRELHQGSFPDTTFALFATYRGGEHLCAVSVPQYRIAQPGQPYSCHWVATQ